MKKYRYRLEGLDCAKCANEIEEALKKDKRFHHAVVNFSTLQLSYESEEDIYEDMKKIVLATEPDVNILKGEENLENKKENSFRLLQITIGICLTFVGYFIKLPFNFNTFIYLIAYIVLVYRTFLAAITLLWRKRTINENFLITVSTFGAFLIGERLEGLMVIILYEIGKLLESRALHVTRKSIKELMNIKAEWANKKVGEEICIVKPEELKIGDCILVKVGEKIPVDGKVVRGISFLDTSSLTGESRLIQVNPMDTVLSGSINKENLLEIEVEKEYKNSTVYQILELVENATDKKAKTETFVSRATRVYTPIVIIVAIFLAFLLPLVSTLSIMESLYRALTFLVISCPCAIAISVPLSYFSGIGAASKQGILVKGSNYLDALKDIQTIIFDKTGTLTTGKFEIDEVFLYDSHYQKEDILKIAALAEQYSNHPIAQAILKEVSLDSNIEISEYREIPGKGIAFRLGEKSYKIGNIEFVGGSEKKSQTSVYLAFENQVIACITFTDKIKDGTQDGIQAFKSRNLKIYMFTGDNKEIALEIAKKLSIEKVSAEMLPQDKYLELEKILKEKQGLVAFVGDGINDAPVLALADIGISMGGIGSSSAIEASDVVIMNDNIYTIEKGIKIAKYTDCVIRQNLLFAFTVKILVLLLTAFGKANMWQAVFADVGVTLITIMSTLRILKKYK